MFSISAFSANALNFRHLSHYLICCGCIIKHSGPIEYLSLKVYHPFYSKMTQIIMITLQCLFSKCFRKYQLHSTSIWMIHFLYFSLTIKDPISHKQSIVLSDEMFHCIVVSFINFSTVQLLCFKQMNDFTNCLSLN